MNPRPGRSIRVTLVLGALSVLAPAARAAGLILYEMGTRDMGLASAGWSARAEDAATLFRNPAGMSRLPGSNLLVGAQVVYGDVGFRPDDRTTATGNDGGNPLGFLPGLGTFFTHRLPSGVGLGLGAFSYFGLTEEFEDGWLGRYYLEKGTLLGLTLMPAVSVPLSEQVSVGAGLNTMFGIFREDLAVPSLGTEPDGTMSLKDDVVGVGANLGVLYAMRDGTRLGLTYLSPVALDFETVPAFTDLSPLMEGALERNGVTGAPLDLRLTVPQTVMFSFYHTIDEEVAVMGNFGWQNWETFGLVDVALGDTTAVTVDREFQDTWHGAIGVDYVISPRWALSTGFAYDGTPVDDEERPLDFAVGETVRVGAGARLRTSESVRVGLAYSLLWSGDIPIDQFRGPLAGRVAGDFAGTAVHVLALNLEWRL